MQEIEVVNVRLPPEIVKWIDNAVGKGIYKSRSEAIRHFIRQYVLQERRNV
jgi:Arc/MetJ-type ribon-helix-helix transcriptional regulator